MATLKDLLPPKIYEILERAEISTAKEILIMSPSDIKKLTNLNSADIFLLKNVTADCCCPPFLFGDQVYEDEKQLSRVTTGCLTIDKLLQGGFRRGTLTELYGESGSGKTQIAIQAAVHNYPDGTVYICTEDLFPVKRFDQIKKSLPNFDAVIDYGKNIYVEHITEPSELLSCVRMRLPKLLSDNTASLIVIDSVAAPFRTESTNYVQRAEELRELAICLINTAQKHNLAVLCINQVTSSLEGAGDNVLPSLGLAWSNMISTRLWLKRTIRNIDLDKHQWAPAEYNQDGLQSFPVRELSIVFAPDLPYSKAEIIITPIGLLGLE